MIRKRFWWWVWKNMTTTGKKRDNSHFFCENLSMNNIHQHNTAKNLTFFAMRKVPCLYEVYCSFPRGLTKLGESPALKPQNRQKSLNIFFLAEKCGPRGVVYTKSLLRESLEAVFLSPLGLKFSDQNSTTIANGWMEWHVSSLVR